MWHPLSPDPTRDPSRWLRASQDLESGLSEPVMKTQDSTAKWSTASPEEIPRVSTKIFMLREWHTVKPSLCVSEPPSLSLCQMSSWFLQWRASFGWGRMSSWTERRQASITSLSQPGTLARRLATARWGFITQTHTYASRHTHSSYPLELSGSWKLHFCNVIWLAWTIGTLTFPTN